MSKIQLTNNAKEDIRNKAEFYKSQKTGLGHDFFDKLEETFEIIKQNPKQFPQIYGEIRRALINRFPHQILFVIKNTEIIIFAVFHSS